MSSSLSDVFRAHPIRHQHKPLDFTSIQELPESYTWTTQPDDDLHHHHPSSTDESVPVIDLLDHNVIQTINHACKSWGVFQVTNHGIPTSLIDKVEFACNSLFSLPHQTKLKAARSPEGTSGYGFPRTSSFFSKLMWLEGFTIVGSPLEHFQQLWPQDYIKFCDIIEEFSKETEKLAERLLWLTLASLGITKEDIKWASPKGEVKDHFAALQLNYYPACPDPDRAMGLAAHTDSPLLTILHQNKINGLQVLKEGSGWVNVPPVPGGLVVNVGDCLHMLTNGLFPSVLHRAVVNRTQDRLSVAYHYGPPNSVQISPLSKLVGPIQPPLYPPISWTEYLRTKAQYFNKTLSSLKVSILLNENDKNLNS